MLVAEGGGDGRMQLEGVREGVDLVELQVPKVEDDEEQRDADREVQLDEAMAHNREEEPLQAPDEAARRLGEHL